MQRSKLSRARSVDCQFLSSPGYVCDRVSSHIRETSKHSLPHRGPEELVQDGRQLSSTRRTPHVDCIHTPDSRINSQPIEDLPVQRCCTCVADLADSSESQISVQQKPIASRGPDKHCSLASDQRKLLLYMDTLLSFSPNWNTS
jgi:hypothetical protein